MCSTACRSIINFLTAYYAPGSVIRLDWWARQCFREGGSLVNKSCHYKVKSMQWNTVSRAWGRGLLASVSLAVEWEDQMRWQQIGGIKLTALLLWVMRSNRTEAGDHLPPGTWSGRQQRWPARPHGKRWCWGPSLRCGPPAAPPVTDRPGQPLPPPLSAPRRKWQPKRLAGVGRRGRGETVCSGLWPWSGGTAGGLTWSKEGPPTPARGKSKMAASVETEKDEGGRGGGSGAHVTHPAPPLSHQSSLSWERIDELQRPSRSAPPNRNAAGAGGRAAFWSLQSPWCSIVSMPAICREPDKGEVCIFL